MKKTKPTPVPFPPGVAGVALCGPDSLPDGIAAWALRVRFDKDANTEKQPRIMYLVAKARGGELVMALTEQIAAAGEAAMDPAAIPPALQFIVTDGPGASAKAHTAFRIPNIPGWFEFLAVVST